MRTNISHLAPVFPVREMKRSLSFYQKIGFSEEFLWEDPPSYAVLSAGESVGLHLSLLDPKDQDRASSSLIYVFVHDVDAHYKHCLDQEIPISIALADQAYGMREFELKDPDGNTIVFGTSLERLA